MHLSWEMRRRRRAAVSALDRDADAVAQSSADESTTSSSPDTDNRGVVLPTFADRQLSAKNAPDALEGARNDNIESENSAIAAEVNHPSAEGLSATPGSRPTATKRSRAASPPASMDGGRKNLTVSLGRHRSTSTGLNAIAPHRQFNGYVPPPGFRVETDSEAWEVMFFRFLLLFISFIIFPYI